MVVRYRKRINFGKIDNVEQVISFPYTWCIRYYKFDETSGTNADDAVSTNDATLSSSTFTSWGKINYGVDFDGSTGYATMPNILNWVTTYSISFWMKVDIRPWVWTNGWLVGSRPGLNLLSVLQGADWKIYFSAGTDTWITISANTIPTWERHLITAVKNGATQQLYIDWDIAKWGTGTSNTTYTGTGTWYMGRADSAAIWYYNWVIDELWIWNTALTQTDVNVLYNNWNWVQY